MKKVLLISTSHFLSRMAYLFIEFFSNLVSFEVFCDSMFLINVGVPTHLLKFLSLQGVFSKLPVQHSHWNSKRNK